MNSTEGIFNGPSTVKSCGDVVFVNSESLCKFCEAPSTSPNGKDGIVSLISGLLLVSLPLAILWIVAFVVVLPSNSETTWAFPHIGQEVNKGKPPLADRDSTSPVILKGWMVFVGTSLNNGEPYSVSSCARASVNRRSCFRAFISEASTGHLFSSFEVVVGNHNSSAAVAFTHRHGMICSVWASPGVGNSYNQKPSKPIPDEVLSHGDYGI